MALQKWAGAMLALLLATGGAAAGTIGPTSKISDVRGTKHNLSAVPDGSTTPSGGKVPVRAVKATSETQVCVFCHTPHEAESIQFGSGSTALGAPLWNRKLSTTATYTTYTSSSIDASMNQPGGSSKLCLSCHDGTMAIDKVNALNGIKGATVAMNVATPVKMPSGSALTGFTRDLGVNLTNDHPISFTYDGALAAKDGELRTPDGAVVGTRKAGVPSPKMPLENDQIECATCHDPHLRDRATGNGNAKFLRMNRFQTAQPGGSVFVPGDDIICLACHNKGGLSWAYSAHANKGVATPTYVAAAAQKREFPSSSDVPANTNPAVWQVACLNCHDTHTVQGARRLLREGTSTPLTGGVEDGLDNPSAPFSKSAIEMTCYQCHDGSSNVINLSASVPNIKNDFNLTYRMPINSVDQGVAGTEASLEAHDIGTGGSAKAGADFVESQANLGYGVPGNRHAECTDCHNPHRVIKSQTGLIGALTSANTVAKAGTHKHEDANGYTHNNIISGVLRGSFGVEPVYTSTKFDVLPSNTFTVKRGDPGVSALNDVGQSFVTREYQICLKCHSNYGYDDDNVYPNSGVNKRPTLGGLNRTGSNPNGHSNFTTYTNQAKEFQAPVSHQGPTTNGGCLNLGDLAGAAAAYTNCNHRSWHPVMAPTGRTTTGRGGLAATNWRAPFQNIGTQTMYCTDCHGSDTTRAAGSESAMPLSNTNTNEDGNPWGPHGSTNPFLLKGVWNTSTGTSQQTTGLCFKCHNYATYATNSGTRTGFYDVGTGKGDLHSYHNNRIGKLRCNWCHTSVPHGWKNKAFLVNLRDLGPEVGLPAGTAAPAGVYNNGPYYRNAYLRVTNFKASGNWTDSDCGGKDFMIGMCQSPP